MSDTRVFDAVTEPPGWRAPGWVVPLFGLAALVLVPWVVVLVVALPSVHRAAHWDIAWAGFDVALALLLVTVALAAWRRSPWLEGAATATATLLFVDAWFDVLTSSTRAEFLVAIGEAVLVELPAAVSCLLLARAAERRLRTAPDGPSASARPHFRRVGERPMAEWSWSSRGNVLTFGSVDETTQKFDPGDAQSHDGLEPPDTDAVKAEDLVFARVNTKSGPPTPPVRVTGSGPKPDANLRCAPVGPHPLVRDRAVYP